MTIQTIGWPIMGKAIGYVKKWEERINGSGKAIKEKLARPRIKRIKHLSPMWECRSSEACAYGMTPKDAYMNYVHLLPYVRSAMGRI
ncbi:hypothetical protein [Janthinobacterium sp. B9-8]|uniref:hypothetical protein n=1 Tax=Janthinobacterium sp. B9-8 TaxID=1236179 RepID=UPI00061D3506|nr:hypothetical protein [Janthinobacterium sp. B9-8]AMC34747.1 hypothetical protein VN23_09060 [Janthinobacterium sp. B9-8]